LSIPPTRTKDFAKQYLEKFRFSQNSITGLTALFEVLAQRIFKLSYEKAQEASRKRISQSDVQVALKEDGELSWLLVEPVVPLI
jgi:histone H3/H4